MKYTIQFMLALSLITQSAQSADTLRGCTNLSGRYQFKSSDCRLKIREGFKTPSDYAETMDPIPVAFEKGQMSIGYERVQDDSIIEIVQKDCTKITVKFVNQSGQNAVRNSTDSFGTIHDYKIKTLKNGLEWKANDSGAGCAMGICAAEIDRASARLVKQSDGSLHYVNRRSTLSLFDARSSFNAQCTLKPAL